MRIANTGTVPGKPTLEFKGLVQGNSVRTKHIGRDIMANLKNIVRRQTKGIHSIASGVPVSGSRSDD